MASKYLYDPRRYSSIAAVTVLLDCSVRQDIDWGEVDGGGGHAVYALGNAVDRDSGLAAHVASPWFRSLDELNAFCLEHDHDYAQIAERVEVTGWLPEWWFWQGRVVL